MARRWTRALVAASFLVAASILSGAPARAQTTMQLMPAATLGATDNPLVSITPGRGSGDIFAGVSGDGSLKRVGKRSSQSLHAFLGYTHSLVSDARDYLTASLSGSTFFVLTPDLDLGFSGSGTFSRTGRVNVTDLTVVNPEATIPGTTQFLSPMGAQSLSYRPNTLWHFSEGASIAELVYINSPIPLPDTTLLTGELRGERLFPRNAFSLDLTAADSYSGATTTVIGFRPAGHTFIGEGLLGWRRDVTPLWIGELNGGALTMIRPDGRRILAPAAIVSARYVRAPWFVTFTVSQLPVSNMFLGEATVNDQALARVAMPINQSQELFLTGYASYIYARGATDVSSFARAYDQKTLGSSLTYHPQKLPLAATLMYTIIDQTGGRAGPIVTSDLLIQTVTLSVFGVFAWGPGTPGLFSGVATPVM